MAIVYDPHLSERLQDRAIPQEWPREIIQDPVEHYQDALTGVYLAIGKRYYRGRDREMAVSYVERPDGNLKAITIHPIQPNQKQNRLDRGRWVST